MVSFDFRAKYSESLLCALWTKCQSSLKSVKDFQDAVGQQHQKC